MFILRIQSVNIHTITIDSSNPRKRRKLAIHFHGSLYKKEELEMNEHQ